MRPRLHVMAAMLCGIALFATGCTTYYAVTDPAGNKTYYTTHLHKIHGKGYRFVDARTGAKIIIHESEIRKITEEEFKAAGGKD
ncbi:MAG TPA: hypothetical protein VMP11_14235 [Verrucomicrobiae bacterium]|nr:hypothetical protein [Verrucomicrobiae bacterium]